MKIAISTDGKYVSAHFGRCPSFTIVEIENGEIIKRNVLDNPGHSPGNIPQFLNQNGAGYIIAGGMGQRAKMFFQEFGIETILGIDGEIDNVIEKIKNGTLEGGEGFCSPGSGKGYGLDKDECDHGENGHNH
ncbi:MAG: NifB/NifX family molybdenum-iron cluster-binding protein [Spirochaetes bacterium]|nr:NifB/NifX family molybdenum-iron cluster-binding protein [Spirochaetota bacterium]